MLNLLIVFTAQYALYIMLIVALIAWLGLKGEAKKQFVLLLIVSGVLAFVLAKVGAALYFDPRPFTHPGVVALMPHGPDNGFPSDHTLLAVLVACCVMLYRVRFGVILLGIAVLIGVARVIALVHSPIDIIGAIFISAFAVLFTWKCMTLIRNRRRGVV